MVVLRVPMIVVMLRLIMVVIGGRRWGGQTGRFIGQREQRIALGAGKPLMALLAHKQPDENADEQQTEEDCDWYDGHAWNVCTEYRSNQAVRLRILCD